MDVGAVLGGDIVLTTPRFELRPLERTDVGALFDHFSDPAVTEFMDIEPLTARSQAHEIVDWAQGVRADGVGVRWAIRALGGEALIGTCGFNAVVVQRGRRALDPSRAGLHRPSRPGRVREPSSNGRSRGMIAASPRGAAQNPAYRPSGHHRLRENGTRRLRPASMLNSSLYVLLIVALARSPML